MDVFLYKGQKRIQALNIPKDTNPPFVVKYWKDSPLNSGGGIGDQVHRGALEYAAELLTSTSSCIPLLSV